MYLKRSKFLVVGISKSGFSAASALLSLGANCTIYDNSKNKTTLNLIEKLRNKGAKVATNENIEQEVKKCDIVVLSPGVAADNIIPVTAKKLHKKVIGELELGSNLIKNPLVSVTGTNGKTTVCYLVNYILNGAKITNYLAGNMGKPLCDFVGSGDEKSLIVTEVSSFQLETISSFLPHIACILNISPDHLDRHYNMKNYIYLKGRILQNMRESEFAVLNYDDETVRAFADNTRAKVVFFSMREQVDGAYLQDGKIFYKGEFIIDADSVLLKGGYNVANSLAAVCICRNLGVSCEDIARGLSTFQGVKHRRQVICEKNGITYINDSKSTNPHSTISAIENLRGNTILLLGGQDKGEGYDKLFEKIKGEDKIKSLIIFGGSRVRLYDLAYSYGLDFTSSLPTFENAVNYAFLTAKRGDTVLLSPACASFDEFSGFEERGDLFIAMVKKFVSEPATLPIMIEERNFSLDNSGVSLTESLKQENLMTENDEVEDESESEFGGFEMTENAENYIDNMQKEESRKKEIYTVKRIIPENKEEGQDNFNFGSDITDNGDEYHKE